MTTIGMTSKRLYIRDTKTKKWHEVSQTGGSLVTYCGRTFTSASYDKRTSWPANGIPRCQTCVKKALSRRT